MPKLLKQNLLPFSVFITGACVLIVEVVALRVLSPYYGNTIFTVSSVLSVILAALSVGYYAGGRYADRHPSKQSFFKIILLSGIALVLFHFLGLIILPILSVSLTMTIAPLISSLCLFFLPALLLGTLSPYAVKLQSVESPQEGVGSVAGKIFFFSTLGSIVGSLLAGFILIPCFGIDHIFIGCGIILFILGFIPLTVLGFPTKRLFQFLLGMLILTFLTLFAVKEIKGDVLYTKDGIYEKITIYEDEIDGRPVRFFEQDRSSSGAMFLDSKDPTDLPYHYTKYYSIYKAFKPDIAHALVIGGGAYSIPKALLAELPEATIDVSEIEPLLFELAKKYFRAKDDPRLHNYTEDGRRLLQDSSKQYDFILSDVYYSLFSIPSHFTTQEFFKIAKDKLSDNGIFVANLIGDLSRQEPSLIMAEIKTFQTVFPNSYFFAVDSPEKTTLQNIMFVGYNSDKKIDLNDPVILQNKDGTIRSLKDKIINVDRFNLSSYPILTDNFSPVEYLTSKVLKRALVERPFIDGGEMLAIIKQQVGYGPRYMSAGGHKDIQKFLIAEMNGLADEVINQTWDYTGKDGKTYGLTNIISRFNPSEKKRIILGTHYDSKKFADRSLIYKNRPVPGANDSASGVAVLLELARVISQSSTTPNVGIDIVFFDGEEGDENQDEDYSNWKPLGSTYFAENLDGLYGNIKPIFGVVLDMVCDKDLKIFKERSSVQNAPAEVEAFWNIAKKVDSNVFKDEVKYGINDDHTPLNSAGIPSF